VAVKIITLRSCDLHGEGDDVEASETLRLGYDGAWYEIDLCKEHSGEVGEILQSWISRGRRPDSAQERVRRLRTATGESGSRTPASGLKVADLSAEEKELAGKLGWKGKRLSTEIQQQIMQRREGSAGQ
jgi:hypothetical protein